MRSKYLRKEYRISIEDLPSQYKSMNVLLTEYKKISVHTADASLHGMGLVTKNSISDIRIGGLLRLDLFGEENFLYGRVVYVKPGYGLTRIGLTIEDMGAHSEYKDELGKIIRNKKEK